MMSWSPESTSRRGFLKKASLAIPLCAAAPGTLAAAPKPGAGSDRVESGRGYFDKGTRLAISMWDFSWLHATHPGGVYEDLERRVVTACQPAGGRLGRL